MIEHFTTGSSRAFFGVCLIFSGFAGPVGVAADPPLMFVGDMERRGVTPFADSELEQTLQKTKVVTSPVRGGRHALKLQLNRKQHTDENNHRTDFWIKGLSESFLMGEEYWYGFSTFLPDSWQPDTQSELFVQWVGWRDYNPSLAIYIYGEDYVVKKRWSAEETSYGNLWRGKVSQDKGRWIDWVFRVKWSDGKDGLVEAWRNGDKIVSDVGRNCGAGQFAPYFKFGIYKWPWKEPQKKTPSAVTQRTLYFDEIRIGDKNASYDLVSPPPMTIRRGETD